MFKDFFKDLVDSIRKAILDWLTMQAVMGIVKKFSGAALSPTPQSGGTLVRAYSGGILPKVKSFQQFSKGGLTSRPTLAMLGDNPSGKEIVIPTENIKSDEVSGYTRDSKQPINVVNVITEDDFLRVMSSSKGERLVVNMIGRDMQKRGPTFRSANV